jgi:hypothetical protein
MPYRQFILVTVTEENHDKHKTGCKCVVQSGINAAIKFILENVTEENNEVYKKRLSCFTEVVPTFQRSVFWKMLLKKTTKNIIIADDALYSSDTNILLKLYFGSC